MGRWGKNWSNKSIPRPGVVEATARFLKSNSWKGKGQVQLSFCGDPYCPGDVETKVTRDIVELFLLHQVPLSILTKGGSRCLRDIDLFKKFGKNIRVGATLTFIDEERSLEMEPGAALPGDRLDALRELSGAGIETWASFEPVIDPIESLRLMRMVYKFIDSVKIGKINYDWKREHAVDWPRFLSAAKRIFWGSMIKWYVKKDLRDLCPAIHLPSYATDAVFHHLPEWRDNKD